MRLTLHVVSVRSAGELERAFATMAEHRDQGVIVQGVFTASFGRVAQFGLAPPPGVDLGPEGVRRIRRAAGVRCEPDRAGTTGHVLCGADPARRHARRPARGAAHQVRAGHQPQDRQGPGPDDPAVAPAEGGSGDRVRNRRQRQNLEGWTRARITPAPPVPKPTRPPRRPPARPPAPPKPR